MTQFQYDTWNRIHVITYPDQPNGEVLTYFYDSGGLVNRVNGNDDAFVLLEDYAKNIYYDKFGQRLQMDYGNNSHITYAYDPRNRRLTNVQAKLTDIGYTFHNMTFSYDNVGNLLQLKNDVQPPGSFTGGNLGNAIGGPWQKCYQYDDLYRLISSNGSFGNTVTSCSDTTATNTYGFSQSYDSIHNIKHKTQNATLNSAVAPQISYDFGYSYPAPGSPHPHGPVAIGEFNITSDANGNQITTQDTGTNDVNQYLFDEENRLACANKGPQMPSPSCNSQGQTQFIYDHAGVRKLKNASSPTIYPNQYYTDFGGGSGSQFKHIFIGSERILTKKARIAPDRQHWFYHPDHLGSTSMVTNENGQLADHLHYFPFGEVWLEERPASMPEEFFFTAKELDPETGFYDFGARYLDPRFSKWMSTDLILDKYLNGGPNGGVLQPRNLSPYSYALHNPAAFKDPNGLCADVGKVPYMTATEMTCREATWSDRNPFLAEFLGTPIAALHAIATGSEVGYNPISGEGVSGRQLEDAKMGVVFSAIPIGRGAEPAASGLSRALAGISEWFSTQFARGVPERLTASQMNAERGLSTLLARIRFEGHHAHPMFLGGRFNQELETLTGALHDEFHRRLRANLANAGIDLPVGGTRGSRQAWEIAFRQTPSLRNTAIEALQRTSSEFDLQFDTALRRALDNELRRAPR